MKRPPDSDVSYDVVCPHCKRTFEAQLLSGGADRYQGFKCPHCRLFVAYDRAEDADEVDSER